MADDMVVVFSFDAFTRDELLARRLASDPGVPTSSGVGLWRLSALCSALSARVLEWVLPTVGSLVPSTGRIRYWFVDSDTGCDKEVGKWCVGHKFEVVLKTRPAVGGRGISECMLYKMSVKIKEDESSIEVPSLPSERDRPAEERCTPVDKSLVIMVELGTRRPTLFPPRPCSESPWAAPLERPQ